MPKFDPQGDNNDPSNNISFKVSITTLFQPSGKQIDHFNWIYFEFLRCYQRNQSQREDPFNPGWYKSAPIGQRGRSAHYISQVQESGIFSCGSHN